MPKNTYLSAGVYTREFDLSFLPLDIPAVGAAVIGPAVRGPAMVPVAVSTYSEYLRWFGDVFSSGSGAVEQEYKYLTSYAVQEYLRWGEVCTVTRILAGQYRPAYSNVISRAGRVAEDQGTATYTSNDMSFKLISLSDGDVTNSGTKLASDSGSGAPGDETTGNVLQSGARYNLKRK